jgi:hypothetical protein
MIDNQAVLSCRGLICWYSDVIELILLLTQRAKFGKP